MCVRGGGLLFWTELRCQRHLSSQCATLQHVCNPHHWLPWCCELDWKPQALPLPQPRSTRVRTTYATGVGSTQPHPTVLPARCLAYRLSGMEYYAERRLKGLGLLDDSGNTTWDGFFKDSIA